MSELSLYVVSVLLVVISGMANAVWNLFAKRSTDKAVFLGSICIPASLILLPGLVVELTARALPAKAYALLAASMLLQCCYGFLLSKTYTLGDLSSTYPIMRGTGTLFIPVIGVFFLGESLSPVGWTGIGAIVAGMFLLGGWYPRSRLKLSKKPALLAFGIGLCITSYVIVDKMALQYVTPLTLLGLSNIGFMLSMLPRLADMPLFKAEWRANWPVLLLGSVLSPGSYLLYLFAMQLAPIAQMAPIREVGTVFATVLGILVLKETQPLRRISLSAVIAFGIILVGLGK